RILADDDIEVRRDGLPVSSKILLLRRLHGLDEATIKNAVDRTDLGLRRDIGSAHELWKLLPGRARLLRVLPRFRPQEFGIWAGPPALQRAYAPLGDMRSAKKATVGIQERLCPLGEPRRDCQ